MAASRSARVVIFSGSTILILKGSAQERLRDSVMSPPAGVVALRVRYDGEMRPTRV